MTLPVLSVLLDDGTSTYPLNVTSKVLALDGYSVSRGRSDWQGAVTAGELSITFNNSDGFFTVGTGAVFVDQKIKLTETVNGVAYTRFTGYVKSWPTAWPATVVTFSTVQPVATDAQARAERTTLRSMLEEEILLNSPSAYYTLGEPTGSTTAGDTSGNQLASLVSTGTGTAFTMGTGTGPVDGLTATQFFGGKYLRGVDNYVAAASTKFTVEVFALNSTTGGFPYVVAQVGSGETDPFYYFALGFSSTGFILAIVRSPSGVDQAATATAGYADGLLHHILATYDSAGSGTLELFVDGALVQSLSPLTSVVAGHELRALHAGGTTTTGYQSFVGTASHVVVYDNVVLTPTQIASRAGLGLSTLTESGTARITRLAGYADIPVGTLDTSMTNVPTQSTAGASAFTAIQDVADAEGGLVFINGSGNLTFHNRARPSSKTTPDLTLDKQWVTPDVQPVLDDQSLVNYFEATAAATGSVQLARKLTSETTHGRYPNSQTYLVLTDQEALDRANWAVGKLAEPVPRYGTLTINLYGMTASQASTVLAALDLNCWLRVTSMAAQTPGGTTVDVVVEGWQETVTAESWTITCNVVAQSLFTAWILGDATYSVLGSTTILGI